MAIKIPLVVTQDKDLNTFQTQLGKALQPVLANPINGGIQLTGVSLVSGSNTFSTGLSTMQQGWFLTDINASATVYRSAPFNSTGTLTLTSSAATTVSLWVY